MRSTDLLALWISPLAKHIGRPEEAILEDGLLASDFPDSSVHIGFIDGSALTFQNAFYLGQVGKRKVDRTSCRVAVFSSHVGFHEFWIGPDDYIEGVNGEKEPLASLIAQYDPDAPYAEEHKAWDNMAPVGREFGSPDYERLKAQDWADFMSNLSSLVQTCRGLPDATTCKFVGNELDEALNVQAVLMELGHDVNAGVAAAVWRHHSRTLAVDWMSGAETVEAARMSLYLMTLRPVD